jgi:hypothetical protein
MMSSVSEVTGFFRVGFSQAACGLLCGRCLTFLPTAPPCFSWPLLVQRFARRFFRSLGAIRFACERLTD